ncbi:MAG TPA: hypothetical protein VGM29_18645, partial [Polyangiaceae bacterium]
MLALLLVGACSAPANQVQKPTPPDMSSVIQSFAEPTADLDQQTASELSAPAHQLADLIAQLGLNQNIVNGVIDAINARQSDQQTTSDGVATRREELLTDQGYMQVTRICNGWGPTPIPDPSNGNMQLTVGFSDDTVDAVVWGDFTLCRYLVDDSEIQIAGNGGSGAGPINCYLGGSVPWNAVAQAPLLFAVDFDVKLNGADNPLTRAFRIDPAAETIELLQTTSEGDLLVLLSASTPSL